jgi:hypothetical protein
MPKRDGEHERVSVAVAARRLGRTPDAVRKAIRRGTLGAERVGSRWYVLLDPNESGPEPDGPKQDSDTSVQDAYREIIERMRAENERVWRELEARREAERELRVIIARLTDQLQSLPSGTPESPERHENRPDGAQDLGASITFPSPYSTPGGSSGRDKDDPTMPFALRFYWSWHRIRQSGMNREAA